MLVQPKKPFRAWQYYGDDDDEVLPLWLSSHAIFDTEPTSIPSDGEDRIKITVTTSAGDDTELVDGDYIVEWHDGSIAVFDKQTFEAEFIGVGVEKK